MKNLQTLGLLALGAFVFAVAPLVLEPSPAHAQFVAPGGGGSAVKFEATASSGADAFVMNQGARLASGTAAFRYDGFKWILEGTSEGLLVSGSTKAVDFASLTTFKAFAMETGAWFDMGGITNDDIRSDATGGLLAGLGVRPNRSNTARPTCAAGYRGQFWYMEGAGGVKDDVQVCAKDAANAYAWRTIY